MRLRKPVVLPKTDLGIKLGTANFHPMWCRKMKGNIRKKNHRKNSKTLFSCKSIFVLICPAKGRSFSLALPDTQKVKFQLSYFTYI